MRQIVSVAVVIAIASSLVPKPVKANPAVLPAALCSTGVGCVVVGVGLAGGAIAYYVWQNSKGQRIRLTPSGRVFRSDYLQDPEEEITEPKLLPLPRDAQQDESKARKKCRSLAGGRSYRVELINGKYHCFVEV